MKGVNTMKYVEHFSVEVKTENEWRLIDILSSLGCVRIRREYRRRLTIDTVMIWYRCLRTITPEEIAESVKPVKCILHFNGVRES